MAVLLLLFLLLLFTSWYSQAGSDLTYWFHLSKAVLFFVSRSYIALGLVLNDHMLYPNTLSSSLPQLFCIAQRNQDKGKVNLQKII
jgi:hypothetical protein